MTRAQLRARLEKRLQDTTTEQWSLAEKNDLLNDGLREIQKRIMFIDPFFLIEENVADITINEARIKKPLGFMYEFSLERKDPTSGIYSRMYPIDDEESRQRDSSASVVKYSHDGQYFKLSPTPSASIVDGFRLKSMQTLTMAADSDVPDVHIMLHQAIVIAAQLMALGDTGVAREAIAQELEGQANPQVIGLYYHRSAAEQEQSQYETGKIRY